MDQIASNWSWYTSCRTMFARRQSASRKRPRQSNHLVANRRNESAVVKRIASDLLLEAVTPQHQHSSHQLHTHRRIFPRFDLQTACNFPFRSGTQILHKVCIPPQLPCCCFQSYQHGATYETSKILSGTYIYSKITITSRIEGKSVELTDRKALDCVSRL